MKYEINLCCPDCGHHVWNSWENLEYNEVYCDNCGCIHTMEEMEIRYFKVND